MAPILARLGKAHSRSDLVDLAANLTAEANALHADIVASLHKSAIRQPNGTCYPSWAGGPACGAVGRHGGACGSSRYHYPSADMCGGGTQPGQPMPSLWRNSQTGMGVTISTPAALFNDDAVGAIGSVFASSANSMTRGTWTSAEVPTFGVGGGAGTGFSPWPGTNYASNLKKLLVYEHPVTRQIWIGKAIPRAWLALGEKVIVRNTTSRYGRLSFVIAAAAPGRYHVNVTFSSRFAASPPPGGLKIRIRSPEFPGKKITGATVGGKPVPLATINATEETVAIDRPHLWPLPDLENIVVVVGDQGPSMVIKSDDHPPAPTSVTIHTVRLLLRPPRCSLAALTDEPPPDALGRGHAPDLGAGYGLPQRQWLRAPGPVVLRTDDRARLL